MCFRHLQLPSLIASALILIPLSNSYAQSNSAPPGGLVIEAPLVSPSQSEAILQRRPVVKDSSLALGTPDPKGLAVNSKEAPVGKIGGSDKALTLACTPPAADPEIAELARALKYDSSLIFEFVYNNIEFEPSYGSKKGALGTLLDRKGNSFDQSVLLAALRHQSCLSAKFAHVTIRITPTQLSNWFGVANNETAISTVIGSAGIPATIIKSGSTVTAIDLAHMMVDTNPCVPGPFPAICPPVPLGSNKQDPSFKDHTSFAPINLATAMGYNQTTFMNSALVGSTSGAGFVQNINRTAVRSGLATSANNLISYIRTNLPNATLEQVYGGRQINPLTSTPTSVAYAQSGVISPSMNPQYETTLRLQAPGIDLTFNTSQVYGKRLTIFYDTSRRPVLRQNGNVLATGTAGSSGGTQTLTMTVNHPYPALSGTYGDRSYPFTMRVGGNYAVINAFGPVGRGMVERHRNLFLDNRLAGNADTSEPVLGESVYFVGMSFLAARSQVHKLQNGLHGVIATSHDWLGLVGDTPNGQQIDISSSFSFTSHNNTPLIASAASYTASQAGSVLESGTLEQRQPVGAVSTVTLIDYASSQGQKIFDATSANWNSVKTQLAGYQSGDTTAIQNAVNGGRRIVLPQRGDLQQNNWRGVGYYSISTAAGSLDISSLISGGLKGGYADTSGFWNSFYSWLGGGENANYQNASWFNDPINVRTGEFVYSHGDLEIGSTSKKNTLSFERSYSSGHRRLDTAVGRGWWHNWRITATVNSDTFEGLGYDSAIDAAAATAALYISHDLFTIDPKPLNRIVVSNLATRWFIDQLTRGSVWVDQPEFGGNYVLLPDGTYNPPPGQANTLVKNPDGSFKLRGKFGDELQFNLNGDLASWKDKNNNTTTLSYDGSKKLTTISNAFGRTLTFGYTGARISSVSDGTGRSIGFAYDGAGNLITYTDADSKSTTYQYDSPGRMTKIFYPSNPAIAFVTNVYDTQNRVKTQADAIGNLYTYYFANETRAEEEDPRGKSFTSYFNRSGQLLQSIDKVGQRTSYVYDGQQRLIKTTQPEGNSAEYAYDSKHNTVTKTIKPKTGQPDAPLVWQYTYHSVFNGILTELDPLSRTTTYTYDANGNVLTQARPSVNGQSVVTTNTYGTKGLLETTTDPEGKVTKNTYNTTTGDVLSVIDDFGISRLNLTMTYTYDTRGNRTTVSDPRGHTTTTAFNVMRLPTQVTPPAPFSTSIAQYTYDNSGRVLTKKVATGDALNPFETTTWTYSPSGKVLTLTDPRSKTTTKTYDNLDRVATVTDPQSRVTQTQYDDAGRISKIIDATTVTAFEYAYTANGKVLSRKDARANVTNYSYDAFDRSKRITYPGGSYEESTWDGVNNLLSKVTRGGQTISFTYDALNRKRTESRPGSMVLTYNYDRLNRLKEANDGGGAFTFGFDTAGRLTNATRPDSKVVSYQLDAMGNRTRVTWPDAFYVDYTYDNLNRLATVREQGAISDLAVLGYDVVGRRSTLTYRNGVISTTTYNLDDRIASISHQYAAENISLTYGYNNAGQRTSVTASDDRYIWSPSANSSSSYSSNGADQYTVVAGTSLTHDANGNLTYDGVRTFSFNAVNQLTTVAASGLTVNYSYDSLNRRTAKLANSIVTNYLHDGSLDREIAEYDGAGNLLRRYIYGSGLDELLAFVPVLSGINQPVQFVHADGLGSSIAITDVAGAVLERYAHGPYGEVATLSGLPVRYTGRRLENESELYYYRARFYSPILGRFLSPDPSGYAASPNLYVYVNNDPINNVDPTGHQTVDFGIGGNVVGGFVSIPFGIGIVADVHGNVGLYAYGGVGVGTGLSAGIGPSVGFSTAPTILDIAGGSYVYSADAYGGFGGSVDTYIGEARDGSSVLGSQFTFGIGGGVGVSGSYAKTVVLPLFNLNSSSSWDNNTPWNEFGSYGLNGK